jgi:hypothetical protein
VGQATPLALAAVLELDRAISLRPWTVPCGSTASQPSILIIAKGGWGAGVVCRSTSGLFGFPCALAAC